MLLKTLPLVYISSNSLVEIDLISLIMILSKGTLPMVLSCPLILISLSIWALLLLLLLIILLLNSDHPGGGCLIETRVKLFGCLVLLVLLLLWLLVGPFGSSTSIKSSSQSDPLHQHYVMFINTLFIIFTYIITLYYYLLFLSEEQYLQSLGP